MTTIDATRAQLATRTKAAAAQPPDTGSSSADPTGPHTLQWQGSGFAGSDQFLPTVVGSAGGLAGLVGGAAAVARSERGFHGIPPLLALAGAGIIGAGLVGGAAFGATTGLHALLTDDPPPVDPSKATALPTSVTPAGSPGDHAPEGRTVGNASGDYQEWVTVQDPPLVIPMSDGKGNTTYTYIPQSHNELQTFPFDDDLRLRGQIGRLDGYPDTELAEQDLAGREPAAVVQDGGRAYLYGIDDTHWDDIDELRVDDGSVASIVDDDHHVWSRANRGNDWVDTGRSVEPGSPVSDVAGKVVARLQQRNAGDPTITAGTDLGPGDGYQLLSQALGDVAGRPGDQAVVRDGTGRFHVLSTSRSGDPDHGVTLEGIRTTKDSTRVEALELLGSTYRPAGEWYLTPAAGSGS